MYALNMMLPYAVGIFLVGWSGPVRGASYVQGEVLVKFRPDVSGERQAEIFHGFGDKAMQSWPEIGWTRVQLKEGTTVPEAIQAYRKLPEVENAEPNFETRLDTPPQAFPPGLTK
jgi:hypothetical protein